jgi:hypothetical protein
MNFSQDTSTQSISSLSSSGVFDNYALSSSLSIYQTIANTTTLSNTLQTNINNKDNILTFSSPLTRSVNNISIDLNNYYNKTEVNNINILNNYYNKSSTDTLLNAKQNTLISTTTLSGIGSNLTLINYNNLSNLPNLGLYQTISNTTSLSNTLQSNINLKQNTLVSSTTLTGIGSNLTLINYNNLSNLPNLSLYALSSSLSSYQPLLISTSTLSGIGSNLTLINYNNLSNLPNLGVYALSSSLSSYQPLLISTSTLSGIGSNLTLINYNNLSNLPNLSLYALSSSLSSYQPLLISTSTLSGIGSNLTLINYNNLSNLPNLNLYQTITNTNSLSNTLQSNINLKQNTLISTTTLSGIGSNLTLINYNNLSNLPNLGLYALSSSLSSYLPLTGGTLTGSIIINTPNAGFFLMNQNGAAFGEANSAAAFSSSAAIGDCIVRSKASSQLILQSGIGGSAIIINSANNTNIKNNLDVSGNIGIGTSNAISKLDVRGNIISQGLSIVDSSSYSSQFQLYFIAPTATTSAQIQTIRQGFNFNQNLNLQPNGGTITLTGSTNCSSTLTVGGILRISETTGTAASANSGTIILDHDNSSGVSSIVFRSKINRGSDFGYIQYNDNLGSGGESGKLIIGTQNDADDDIILMPSGRVGIGTALPQALLDVSGSIICSTLNASGSITSATNFISNSGISTFKAVYITNPNGTITHFPYTNGENYIRGKVNIDNDLYVGGASVLNGITTLNNNLSTPQISTSSYNNLLAKTITIYPFSSVGGTYNNGYWLIDVQDYASQSGFVYLFLNINVPSFLYWQGRIVIGNSSSITFYPDLAFNVNLSLISSSSRLNIVIACPSGTGNGFQALFLKIMG